MDILIKNAKILTMDESMDIIDNGCIAIRDDKIFFVSKEEIIPPDFSTANTIDAKGKLVMPGLINAHTHLPMSLFRNYADDLTYEKWFSEKIYPLEKKLTGEIVYWGAMLSIVEMIKTGTTTFAEHYFFMEDVAKAVEETGIRANLAINVMKPDNETNMSADRNINKWLKLFKDWDGNADGRIKVVFGFNSVFKYSVEYLKEIISLIRELNSGVCIHLPETKKEIENNLKNFGCTPIEYCNKHGMFEVATVVEHCVNLTDSDLNTLAEKSVSVAYTPGSDMKVGRGIARVPEMLHKGINICLGTDSPATNNNLDMFKEMRLAGLINKGYLMNPTLMKAVEILRMAVNNGAEALKVSGEVGVIRPGMKADIIILNTDRVNYIPRNNIISALVYSANGLDVETVIVNGKILMEKGELKTIDEEKVIFQAEYQLRKLFK